MKSISACCDNIARLKQKLDTADAVVIGAGSGLSIAAKARLPKCVRTIRFLLPQAFRSRVEIPPDTPRSPLSTSTWLVLKDTRLPVLSTRMPR